MSLQHEHDSESRKLWIFGHRVLGAWYRNGERARQRPRWDVRLLRQGLHVRHRVEALRLSLRRSHAPGWQRSPRGFQRERRRSRRLPRSARRRLRVPHRRFVVSSVPVIIEGLLVAFVVLIGALFLIGGALLIKGVAGHLWERWSAFFAALESQRWTTTTGKVTRAVVTYTSWRRARRYAPAVRYTYSVGGEAF